MAIEAKIACQYCGKEFSKAGIANHEKACPENPQNKVNIEVRDPDLSTETDKEPLETTVTIVEGEPDKLVEVKLKDNFQSFIGDRYYRFEANKIYKVSDNVKEVLQRAGMLEADRKSAV